MPNFRRTKSPSPAWAAADAVRGPMKNMGIRVPRLVLLQLTYLALVERSNVATIVRNMVVDVAYERCPTSIRNDPEALLAAIRELKVQQVDEELEELSDSPDEAAALVLEEQNE